MLKKILSLILALLMLVPMAVSCGNDTDGPAGQNVPGNADTENGGQANADEEEDPLISVIDEYTDELSSKYSFKGESFSNFGIGWQAPTKEEETGDVRSDAYYYRQREIEELYELTWKNVKAEGNGDLNVSATVELIKQDVLAGVGAYDAAYGLDMHCQNLLINDALYDVSTFDEIDFEREWWPEGFAENYSISGSLYFLNGPISSSFYQDGSAVIFNKQVAENYGIPDLYEIVKSGEWTFDKMFEIASVIPENQGGSGAYRYGNPDGIATLVAHGMSLVKFNENGEPYYEESVSKELSDLADKFSKIYSDDSITVNLKGFSTGNWELLEEKYGYESMDEMFADEKMLFMFTPTDNAAELRLLDVQFGILPMPKGSTAQEDYVSYAYSDSICNVFVPKSIKNSTKSDVVLETMAALGYKYFKHIYYDTMLKSRSVYDHESKDMIDIIFATKKYDMVTILDKGAGMNSAGIMTNIFSYSITESAETLTSRYFINSKIANSNLKSILRNIAAENAN